MSSTHHHATAPGFTLVELILSLGLSLAVLVATLRVLLLITAMRLQGEATLEVQQNLHLAADRITAVVLQASGLNAASSLFNIDQGVLSLAMSDALVNPTIFSLSNGIIFVREGGTAPLPLTASGVTIDRLRFVNLSATGTTGTVKVVLHGVPASGTTTTGSSLTLETSLSLRP